MSAVLLSAFTGLLLWVFGFVSFFPSQASAVGLIWMELPVNTVLLFFSIQFMS
jgi:hypothetical protein